jgi:hypothetical protein
MGCGEIISVNSWVRGKGTCKRVQKDVRDILVP